MSQDAPWKRAACARCGAIAELRQYASGLVELCARCAPQTDPLDHAVHTWRGTGSAGTWWCEGCGKTLGSQDIVIPKEDPAQTPDMHT